MPNSMYQLAQTKPGANSRTTDFDAFEKPTSGGRSQQISVDGQGQPVYAGTVYFMMFGAVVITVVIGLFLYRARQRLAPDENTQNKDE